MIKSAEKEFHGQRKNTGENTLRALCILSTCITSHSFEFLESKVTTLISWFVDALSYFNVVLCRRFLLGLLKYGKGDWRNISRNFVGSKTPTQVASHAQKYYQRQVSGAKDKRRPSIHDITTVNLLKTNLNRPSSDSGFFVSQPAGPELGFTNHDNAEEGVMFLGQKLSSALSPYNSAFKFTGTNVYGDGT